MIEITVLGMPGPQGRLPGSASDPKTGRFMAKHGYFGTAEYQAWQSMIKRCTKPSNASFSRYGARGITICQRWRDSFSNFITDMGIKPSNKYSLDRIDNNAGYSAENCRWATASEQQCNRNSVRFIEHHGERLPLAHWSKKTGIAKSTLAQRLSNGWTAEMALTTVPDKRRASR